MEITYTLFMRNMVLNFIRTNKSERSCTTDNDFPFEMINNFLFVV